MKNIRIIVLLSLFSSFILGRCGTDDVVDK